MMKKIMRQIVTGILTSTILFNSAFSTIIYAEEIENSPVMYERDIISDDECLYDKISIYDEEGSVENLMTETETEKGNEKVEMESVSNAQSESESEDDEFMDDSEVESNQFFDSLDNSNDGLKNTDISLLAGGAPDEPSVGNDGKTTWNCIYFGNYWQSDTNGDGVVDSNDEKEPIKWRILNVNDDQALIISDKSLYGAKYNLTNTDVDWENCTLRSWLNNSFYDDAFSSTEKYSVCSATLKNNSGNDTSDKVFILSKDDIQNTQYGFNSDNDRIAICTKYAQQSDACHSGDLADWWIRSSGNEGSLALSVDSYGKVDEFGSSINLDFMVRPAIYIKLSAYKWRSAGTVSSDGTETETNPQETYGVSNPYLNESGDVVWSCLWFGHYWTNDTNGDGVADRSDTKQPIKWRVVFIDGNDAFVVADKIIDYKPYNEQSLEGVNWKQSTIRSWLNGYDASANECSIDYGGDNLLNNLFSASERDAIIDTDLYYSGNQETTTDKLFLLSYDDLVNANFCFSTQAFSGDSARCAKPTDFANAQSSKNYSGYSQWWLRPLSSTESRMLYAGVVYSNGDTTNLDGYYSTTWTDCGVRPAIHIDLNSEGYSIAGTVCSDGTEDESGSGDENTPGELDATSDLLVIEEVNKYTNDGDWKAFQAIMQSNRSEEEKFRLLNELFHNRGITDPGEGVKYLSDVSSHRRDYLYLTTNENYCAFNWWYWLNDTTKGKIARGLLYSDGLIFDNELTSYIDWSTYANSSYPGVEKCKTMLKDFMLPDSDDAPVSEVASNSKKTLKAIKNAVKLNDMVEDASLEEIMNHVVNAKTQKELEKYQNQFANWMIQQTKVQQEITINGETKLYLGTEGISKCLGYSASIISFSASTTQDIVDILNLEDNIQHYMEYDNFLKSVYSDEDVSKEMRIAAYQLHDDIENGYFNEIRSILSNFIDMGVSLIYLDKGLLETYLQTHGMSTVGVGLLGEALGTLTLGTVISNIIIDAGDFTKQAAYTEAYAELSTLYSFKLQDDKTNFLANPTTDNAWKFYEDYNLLWRLRYKGEQQYLRMHEIKAFIFGKIKACGYETKASVVQDILDILSNNKFEMADSITVPESISYVKKMVIDCPVDVTVKTKSGTVIAVLKDGELSDITNEYGRFAVVYQSYSDEYAKVICQLTNDDLDIDVSATNAGIVSYHSASAASDEYYSFSNIPVETGDMIKVKETSYQITSIDGDEAEKVELTKNDDTYVKPSSIALSKDSLSLIVGDNEVADVSILPATATNKDVIWYSEDDSIATVKNGLIHALAVGDTTIWVRACDGDELEKSISIHVEDSAYTYMITATAGAGGTITPSGTKDVAKGSSQTYTITANTGYSIEDVKVDGVSQGGIDTYTFSNVQEAHTIGATFKSVDSPEEGSFSVGFSNVSTDQYLGLRFNSDNSHYETVYTGTVIKPEIAVTGLNGVLIEGVDYTVKYSNNLNYNSKGKPAIITVTGKGNYAGKKELNFYILQTDLSVAKEKGLLTLEDEYKIQSGRKVSPIITYGDYTLKAADMNISNKSAIKADTTISVSGKGNFTGTLEGIAVKVLSAAEIKSSTIKVTLKPTTHIYNGNSHALTYSTSATKGELTVTAGSSTTPLTEGTDYTVTYKNNTNAGTATVKIKGIGSYIGNVTKTFKIQPDKTSSMTATLKDSNAIIYYSSSGVNPEVVVTVTRSAGDSETLTEGKDYKVSYSNNKKVGNGKYSITFIGNYKGQKAIKNKTFTITAAPFNGAVASSPDKVYSKAGKYLSAPYVSIDGIQLTSKDYNVKYFDGEKEITSKTKVSLDSDVQSKKITVKITGKGNYQTQEITTTYQILKASATTIDLSKAKIVANAKNAKGKDVAVGKQEYSGAEIKPDIRVLFKIGKTWTEVPASTYSVTYINNIRKGTATIIITGDGTNSVGSLTTKFTIGSKSLGLFQWLFGN